jgi:hypothetical protein
VPVELGDGLVQVAGAPGGQVDDAAAGRVVGRRAGEDLDGAERAAEGGQDLADTGVVVEQERGGRLDRDLDRLWRRKRALVLIYSPVPTTCSTPPF